MKPRFYDISPTIGPRTAVFPGDRAYERRVSMAFDRGHALELSSVESTLHIGAHADAPSHYRAGGASIEVRNPLLYIGAAQVIRVQVPRGARIEPGHLGSTRISAPRVLLRTDSFPDPNRWSGDFNSLSPALVEHLAEQGVRLIGIDTPSVDPAEDKGLESHQAIAARDLAILEGIVLNEVPDGTYFLVAPPLRLDGADASPVRALLLTGEAWDEIGKGAL
jgi:arylformamidase